MTKGRLVQLLEDIPDDYEVLIDSKKLWTIFANHEEEIVNLSSELLLQHVHVYDPTIVSNVVNILHINKQMTM